MVYFTFPQTGVCVYDKVFQSLFVVLPHIFVLIWSSKNWSNDDSFENFFSWLKSLYLFLFVWCNCVCVCGKVLFTKILTFLFAGFRIISPVKTENLNFIQPTHTHIHTLCKLCPNGWLVSWWQDQFCLWNSFSLVWLMVVVCFFSQSLSIFFIDINTYISQSSSVIAELWTIIFWLFAKTFHFFFIFLENSIKR